MKKRQRSSKKFTKKESLKLSQEAYDFLNIINTTHKVRSVNQYESCIRCLFRFLNKEKIEFKKINRDHIEKWLIWMQQLGHQNATRFRRVMSIRYFLRWCSEHGILKEEQGYLIKKDHFPKVPKRLPRPYPPDMDRLIIQRLEKVDHITAKALLLTRHTGIRIGETQTLPRECIHEEVDGKKSLKVPLGKMDKERLVPLTQEAVDLIHHIQDLTLKNVQTYAKRNRPLCPQCGVKGHNDPHAPTDPNFVPKRLIVLKNGRYPSYSGIRSAWNAIVKDLRKKHDMPITIHRLRHTYATSMLTGGMSIVSLMKILGHSDIRMTLVYGDVTKEKLHEEYFNALKNLNERYSVRAVDVKHESVMVRPHAILSDIVKWLDKNSHDVTKEPHRFFSILKRLKIIEKDLKAYGLNKRMPLPT